MIQFHSSSLIKRTHYMWMFLSFLNSCYGYLLTTPWTRYLLSTWQSTIVGASKKVTAQLIIQGKIARSIKTSKKTWKPLNVSMCPKNFTCSVFYPKRIGETANTGPQTWNLGIVFDSSISILPHDHLTFSMFLIFFHFSTILAS